MAACRYAEIRKHKREHRDFVDWINLLPRRFDDNPEAAAEVVNRSLLEFLQDWLNRHIAIEAMGCRPYVEQSPLPRWRASTAQKLFAPPPAPMRPSREGRAIFAASGARAGLKCSALRRNALLTGGKNRRKAHWVEMGQYQAGLV